MSVELLPYTQKIANYLFENSVRDLDILKKLREKTQSVVGASMQISPQQGQLIIWVQMIPVVLLLKKSVRQWIHYLPLAQGQTVEAQVL